MATSTTINNDFNGGGFGGQNHQQNQQARQGDQTVLFEPDTTNFDFTKDTPISFGVGTTPNKANLTTHSSSGVSSGLSSGRTQEPLTQKDQTREQQPMNNLVRKMSNSKLTSSDTKTISKFGFDASKAVHVELDASSDSDDYTTATSDSDDYDSETEVSDDAFIEFDGQRMSVREFQAISGVPPYH